MIELLVYLAGVSTQVSVVLFVVGFVGLAMWFIGAGVSWLEGDTRMPPTKLAIVFIALLAIGSLTPSKESLYTIAGFRIVDSIKETPEFEKARRVLNIELDKILKEQK